MKKTLPIVMLILFILTGCAGKTTGPVEGAVYEITGDRGTLVVREIKAPSIQFFSVNKTSSKKELIESLPSLAQQIGLDIVKRAKLEINGPLTLVFQNLPSMKDGPITADIGFPTKGRGPTIAKYNQQTKDAFKCLSLAIPHSGVDSAPYWAKLYEVAAKQGYKISSESRTLIAKEGNQLKTELQLGIL